MGSRCLSSNARLVTTPKPPQTPIPANLRNKVNKNEKKDPEQRTRRINKHSAVSIKSKQTTRSNAITPLPYTEATDYMVYRHYFDPLDQLSVQYSRPLHQNLGKIEIIRSNKTNGISKGSQIISSHKVEDILYRTLKDKQITL